MVNSTCNYSPLNSSVDSTYEKKFDSFTGSFYGRTIQKLDRLERWIDSKKMPCIIDCAQKILDTGKSNIESIFTYFFEYVTCNKIKTFNTWLNEYSENTLWYKGLVEFLVKLPFRVARNIATIFCQLIDTLLNTAIHPMKAMVKALRFLTQLIHSLESSEGWMKMGISIMGSAVGICLIPGNPLSIMGFAIGSAFALGGLVGKMIHAYRIGSQNARISPQNALHAAAHSLYKGIKILPEIFLTSMVLGTITGAIRRYQIEKSVHKLINEFDENLVDLKIHHDSIDLLIEDSFGFYEPGQNYQITIGKDFIYSEGITYTCQDAQQLFLNFADQHNSAYLTTLIESAKIASVVIPSNLKEIESCFGSIFLNFADQHNSAYLTTLIESAKIASVVIPSNLKEIESCSV